jgi:paraquat-inducible protein A
MSQACHDPAPPAAAHSPAAATGWLGCACCGLVAAVARDSAGAQRCLRCGQALHWRKPMSVQRTWAYLTAAAVAYIPANLLPIMHTTQALRSSPHTLLGGIIELWHDGAWGLALIVFIASIAVPLMKIGALALLAWSVQYAPRWRRLERARVFGLIEAVGHWSMLDVYVVVLLVAMVRFGAVASALPGPGLLAFAAVVVLTMLAAQSFDARLIWQEPPQR